MIPNNQLHLVATNGWRTGLVNLLRKENRSWWASRRWLLQGILGTVLLNGFIALLVLVLLPYGKTVAPDLERFESLTIGTELLFKIVLLALAFRSINLAQDAILGERQLGVTEWLLSRPVSRQTYVLSKLIANSLGVLVVMVGSQGVIGYVLLSLIMGKPFPLLPYLTGIAGLAVHTLFYLTITLMMGVMTTNRRNLLGVVQGVLLGGTLLTNLPGTALMVSPWGLIEILPVAVLGLPLPISIWLPIGVTAILTIFCVAIALVKFNRLEL
jgi:ABC-2 type transport system permease protein